MLLWCGLVFFSGVVWSPCGFWCSHLCFGLFLFGWVVVEVGEVFGVSLDTF